MKVECIHVTIINKKKGLLCTMFKYKNNNNCGFSVFYDIKVFVSGYTVLELNCSVTP